MVYVIDSQGNPLMPTHRLGKVRRWLKQGKAIVVGHSPFTIKLLFETGNCIQSLTLGINKNEEIPDLTERYYSV